jgi:hypothetical protein
MRDSLTCDVELRRFGVWRAGVGVLAISALATLAAWAMSGSGSRPALQQLGAALAALAVICLAMALSRVEAGRLRRDGGRWRFMPARADASAPEEGEIVVALDLGSFMLLSFAPRGARDRRARRWLPVQRRGLEHDWHALRCAVYSPPAAPGDVPGAAPPLPE